MDVNCIARLMVACGLQRDSRSLSAWLPRLGNDWTLDKLFYSVQQRLDRSEFFTRLPF